MKSVKTEGPKFEVGKYDGRSDYLLWERQVKGVFCAMGLGRVLKSKPDNVVEDDWKDAQKQAMSTIMLYLQPHIIKQVEDYAECALLFAAL